MRTTLLLVLAAAACGGTSPPPAAPAPIATVAPAERSGKLETRCELTADVVRCHTTNGTDDWGIDCVEPYLGVRETGALLSGTSKTCSPAVRAGERASFDAPVGGRPADVCGPELAGCVVRLFSSEDGEVMARIVTFARELEAAAPHPGRDHPTTGECDQARRAWLAIPELADRYRDLLSLDEADLVAAFCIQLPRQDFECLAAAKVEADVEACAPDLSP
jgi:hypothetical protein